LLPFLLAGEHSYGLVPYGSGNDVARTLGLLEMSWQDALRHALSADTVHVDVAVAHDEEGARQRHFLGCFLLGIDGHISNQTQNWKFRGPIPYFVTLLKELPRLRGWNLQVHWETSSGARQQQDGWMLLCSLLNTPTYGSGYPIAPMASMTDGALNLLIAPTVAWWRFLLLFFKMLRGTHLTDPVVRLDDVRQMRVQSPSPLCLSADGERLDWQCNSLAIRMLPKRLAVVAIGR
jgi:diacylglycerol kinase family enzyme